MISARTAAALALLPLTSGCIAAVALAPIAVSSGAIAVSSVSAVNKSMEQKRAENSARVGTAPEPKGPPVAIAQTPPTTRVTGPAAAAAGVVPETMQYLYGSGEAAGLSSQAYRGLTRYLNDTVTYVKKGAARQKVLSDGSSLSAPQFEPCGPKPMAVVLDVDETALLNMGYEGDAARRGGDYDADRWARWEASGADKVVAVPGAREALDAARAAGIAVIFNSNRSNASAAQTEAALNQAGLGPVKHGSTLWLRGDDGGGSGKDDRRWAIASGYCIVALVGDQLGDFSDLFNDPSLTPAARRALSGSPAIASLWGNGWFMLPNPVYGSALKGSYDDVFPADTRWSDPAATPPR